MLTRSLRFAAGCDFRACPCSLSKPVSFSRTVMVEELGRSTKEMENCPAWTNHQTAPVSNRADFLVNGAMRQKDDAP